MKDDSFTEKVIYRLVKRYIAGTTMGSALSKVKELNEKNIPASITFLGTNPTDKTKVRYATYTYVELIRRISRLGLKASVQIPISQIGAGFDEEMCESNLAEIVKTGNKYGVFIWAELDSSKNAPKCIADAKGIGVAVDVHKIKNYFRSGYAKPIKVIFSSKAEGNSYSDIKQLLLRSSNMVLLSLSDKELRKALANGGKKKFTFEFMLGHSKRRIKGAMAKGARVSINVPFGKDWVAYATNKLPEGYMRILVNNLLKDKGAGNGS